MRIAVHAVGRMKSGPERELAARYFDRFAKAGPAIGLTLAPLMEIAESRAATAEMRKREEAAKPLTLKQAGTRLVLLDERGEMTDSQGFAKMIADARDGGLREVAFCIGGPDGHDASLRANAGLLIAFGRLTLPHQIARILLAEQLYRAATIISGHPYHRQ
jgi:23S rRNA (pseudouridine1915-N3)-methyltransferase